MKTTNSSPISSPRVIPLGPRALLRPRAHYPNVSIVPLRRSPLSKLAWVFGFGR